MDEALIDNWNEKVKPGDDIYHLGDFALTGDIEYYLKRLNGNIHILIGSHDNVKKLKKSRYVCGLIHIKELKLLGYTIILGHYAYRVWPKSHYGSINLYGHSHGNLPGTSQSCDVGIDSWDYKPISLEQIIERMSTFKLFNQEDMKRHK